jgi:hypothetical protein
MNGLIKGVTFTATQPLFVMALLTPPWLIRQIAKTGPTISSMGSFFRTKFRISRKFSDGLQW